MRGKAALQDTADFTHGITPAYAGKSELSLQWLQNNQDHPRLCGEKLKVIQQVVIHEGSPPPMRGKEDLLNSTDDRIRITPAYAGKSSH